MHEAKSQLTVDDTRTAQELVEDVLLGTGVQVSNITYTGSTFASGSFDGSNSNIGFDGGVILASGRVTNAVGPNNTGSRTTNFGLGGDSDLDALISPLRTADAAVLEFDFRVPADTIFFDYVFASEEYPEFAPPNSSSYSDAFGFLLSGPNPAGGNYNNVNLAVIPGTNTTVEINNVNAVTNTTYYVSNGNGSSPPQNTDPTVVQYDAFTVPLTATAAVVPCATYHIKLVVADGWRFFPDRVYDSGVFLKENSFGANVKNPVIDFLSTAPGCVGDSIDFLTTGTSSNGILYSWDFGQDATPANSSLENPTDVIYSSPGLKLITYSMNVNCGDTTLVLRKGITIDEVPAPAFTSNAPQCELQPINFTYTGTAGINWTYQWDFGSGASPATSTARDPVNVIYNTPGTKTITLTVRNGNCLETITQTIDINARPTADFSNTGPAGIGYGIDFTNKGTSGVNYQWDFGSGATPATSTAENPSGVSYSTTGTKRVELITTSSGCSDTTEQTLEILVTPTPSFSSNAPQPVGFPVLFSYTGNSGSNFSYSWDFGSGAQPATSTSATPPSVFYSTPGTKTITLTVKNGPIVITITQTITIDQPVVSGFTSTAPNCEGVGIDFKNNGTSGATYAWDFGLDATPATSTQQDPTGVVYGSSGFKTVQLITTVAGNSDTSEATIYIIPQPRPVFTHNAPQCEGAEVNFTYSGNSGTGWNFIWDFGVGAQPNVATRVNPNGILYNTDGTKIVTLSVSNAMCSAVDTQMLTINPTPSAGIFNDSKKCSSDSVSFANTGSAGLTYAWDFGASASPSTSTDENPATVYSSPGIKSIMQVVSQGACSDTAYSSVNVLKTPQPEINGGSPGINVCQVYQQPQNFGWVNFTYTGSSAPGWKYYWTFDNGANVSHSTSMSPNGIYYGSTGVKNVEVRVSNDICVASDDYQVTVDTTPIAKFAHNAPLCELDTIMGMTIGIDTNIPGLTYSWSASSQNGGLIYSDINDGKFVYDQYGLEVLTLNVDIGSCSSSASETIEIYDRPDVQISTTAPLCQGEEVAFYNLGSTESKWKYNWDFGADAFPSNATSQNVVGVKFSRGGSHLVSLRSSDQNCANTDTLTFEIYDLPLSNIINDTIICADECLNIGEDFESGHAYIWFPASTLNSDTAANPIACPSAEFSQYILTKSNTNTSCISTDTVVITMLNSASVNAGGDVEICAGDSVQIGSALIKGQSYVWLPETGLSDASASAPMASPDSTTTYNLRSSYKGCEEIQDQVIVTVRRAKAEAGEDIRMAKGESAQLSGAGGVTYEWSPSDYLSNPFIQDPITEPEESLTYVLKVEDIFNCIDYDSVRVALVGPSLFIPTAFTPNETGRNDVFRVRGSQITSFEMIVYNRTGSVVYYSTDFYSGWDGNNQQTGVPMPQGAYVYKVSGVDEAGEDVALSGVVNLIR